MDEWVDGEMESDTRANGEVKKGMKSEGNSVSKFNNNNNINKTLN